MCGGTPVLSRGPSRPDGARAWRLPLRMLCLAAAVAALWPALPWAQAPRHVAGTSAFVAICASVARRGVALAAAGGLAMVLVCLLRRRWFCRHACPMGLVLEGAAKLTRARTAWWDRCPPVGQYVAVLTLAGAVVGYPLFLWLDPLAMMSSAVSCTRAGGLGAGAAAVAGLAGVVLLTLAAGGLWCSRLCPLGGTQELLASARRLLPSPGRRSAATISVARRAVLAGAAGAVLGLLGRRSGGAARSVLRPPGALEEDRFAGLCIRCGNCVRACPSHILHSDLGEADLPALLAPAVRYGGDYCRVDCNACGQACPSGAIRPLDLAAKRRHVIGHPVVDRSLCLLAQNEECPACRNACPFDAVRSQWDETEYVSFPAVDLSRCNGCGACEVACPTRPRAIRVRARGMG